MNFINLSHSTSLYSFLIFVFLNEITSFCSYIKRQLIFDTNNTFVIFQILHLNSYRVKIYLIFVNKIYFDNEFLLKNAQYLIFLSLMIFFMRFI